MGSRGFIVIKLLDLREISTHAPEKEPIRS
jgi:hypothetical protein